MGSSHRSQRGRVWADPAASQPSTSRLGPANALRPGWLSDILARSRRCAAVFCLPGIQGHDCRRFVTDACVLDCDLGVEPGETVRPCPSRWTFQTPSPPLPLLVLITRVPSAVQGGRELGAELRCGATVHRCPNRACELCTAPPWCPSCRQRPDARSPPPRHLTVHGASRPARGAPRPPSADPPRRERRRSRVVTSEQHRRPHGRGQPLGARGGMACNHGYMASWNGRPRPASG